MWELGFHFYHVGPGDLTQVVRLGSKRLYTLSHLVCLDLIISILSFQGHNSLFQNEMWNLNRTRQWYLRTKKKTHLFLPREFGITSGANILASKPDLKKHFAISENLSLPNASQGISVPVAPSTLLSISLPWQC